MKNKIGLIVLGLILGFVISLPFTVNARDYNNYSDDLLEDIRDNGDDILGKMETIIDRLDRIDGSIRSK